MLCISNIFKKKHVVLPYLLEINRRTKISVFAKNTRVNKANLINS
jgi:hypothetical protein